MKLFSYWRSSTSYRVRIALHLKNIDFDYVSIDLKNDDQQRQDYATLNPHRSVPLLEVGNKSLAQSLAIVDWLDETYPTPSFLPDHEAAIILCKELYYAIATEIHAPNNLSVLKYLKAEFGADEAALNAWNQKWITRTFSAVEARLTQWSWVAEDLPFGAPSLFEIALIPQIYNARRWGANLAQYPNILRIDSHCQTLSAFAKAHPERQPDFLASSL